MQLDNDISKKLEATLTELQDQRLQAHLNLEQLKQALICNYLNSRRQRGNLDIIDQ